MFCENLPDNFDLIRWLIRQWAHSHSGSVPAGARHASIAPTPPPCPSPPQLNSFACFIQAGVGNLAFSICWVTVPNHVISVVQRHHLEDGDGGTYCTWRRRCLKEVMHLTRHLPSQSWVFAGPCALLLSFLFFLFASRVWHTVVLNKLLLASVALISVYHLSSSSSSIRKGQGV